MTDYLREALPYASIGAVRSHYGLSAFLGQAYGNEVSERASVNVGHVDVTYRGSTTDNHPLRFSYPDPMGACPTTILYKGKDICGSASRSMFNATWLTSSRIDTIHVQFGNDIIPDVPVEAALTTNDGTVTDHPETQRSSFDSERHFAVKTASDHVIASHLASAAGIAGAVKRSIDFSIAIACLILFSPIFLILITLGSLDGGSVFYAQTRVGRNGKRFKCWKFRTMVVDAEARLKDLLQKDPVARKEYETYWKLKDDPRITKVGRFLRRYSVDEIPQLINVIIGEMSLVGPRPRSVREAEFFETSVASESGNYNRVRPGLTGLWQISGRNSLDLETKGRLDAYYADHWTLSSDFAIMFATVAVVLRGEGAY